MNELFRLLIILLILILSFIILCYTYANDPNDSSKHPVYGGEHIRMTDSQIETILTNIINHPEPENLDKFRQDIPADSTYSTYTQLYID